MKKTLREWRKERGMSQKRLAEMVGVTGGTIRNWEKGVTEPITSQYTALKKALMLKSADVIIVGKD